MSIQFINKGGGSSEYNAKVNTLIDDYYTTIDSNILELPTIDCSNTTNTGGLFKGLLKIVKVSLINTSNVKEMYDMFTRCSALTTVPLFNTSSAINMSSMFYNCSELTTVPVFDTSNVTNIQYMFRYCNKLSNESLNNILAMCIGATSYIGTKTLVYIGLSSSQATTCQGLSNYQAFLDAGWTTGY